MNFHISYFPQTTLHHQTDHGRGPTPLVLAAMGNSHGSTGCYPLLKIFRLWDQHESNVQEDCLHMICFHTCYSRPESCGIIDDSAFTYSFSVELACWVVVRTDSLAPHRGIWAGIDTMWWKRRGNEQIHERIYQARMRSITKGWHNYMETSWETKGNYRARVRGREVRERRREKLGKPSFRSYFLFPSFLSRSISRKRNSQQKVRCSFSSGSGERTESCTGGKWSPTLAHYIR